MVGNAIESKTFKFYMSDILLFMGKRRIQLRPCSLEPYLKHKVTLKLMKEFKYAIYKGFYLRTRYRFKHQCSKSFRFLVSVLQQLLTSRKCELNPYLTSTGYCRALYFLFYCILKKTFLSSNTS